MLYDARVDDRVRITDVAPRDGLQNEPGIVPVAAKRDLIAAIAGTGVHEIEVTSFVSPKRVPQLADAAELVKSIAAIKPEHARYSALVPNSRGMDRLLEVNADVHRTDGIERCIDKIALFTAASETFSERNVGASIEGTLERFEPVIQRAREHDLATRGYISCAVACPHEGDIEPEAVAQVAGALLDLGVEEIDLGDTIGEGTPDTIARVLLAVIERLDGRHTSSRGEPTLTLHLHDTFGRAADCVRAAIDLGVRSFDASSGGLGGCPFASTPGRRAPGNIAMTDLLDAIEAMGLQTGVTDRAKLAVASATAERIVAAARLESAVEADHSEGDQA